MVISTWDFPEKATLFNRAYLHTGQPDIITRLQALHIVENSLDHETLYKRLALAPDGQNAGDQDR